MFELFDFWDGRDGDVDAFKVGDMCFCLGLNPTQETIKKNGGTSKLGNNVVVKLPLLWGLGFEPYKMDSCQRNENIVWFCIVV